MAFHEADQLWRGTIIAANVNEIGVWAERITPAHIITGSGQDRRRLYRYG